jgi:hypothetical protein
MSLAAAIQGHYADKSGKRGNKTDLHAYWVAGPGLAKWAKSPHPWTELHRHLSKYLSGPELDATVSKWHNEIFAPTGSDRYRVEHGGKMRGKVIGRG